MIDNLLLMFTGACAGYCLAWVYWRRQFQGEVAELRRISEECQRSIDKLEATRREGERLLKKFGARA